MRQVPRRRKMASNVTWADSESRDSAWVQRCIIFFSSEALPSQFPRAFLSY